MARRTPVVHDDTLVDPHLGPDQVLAVGSSDWFTWLSTASIFAFRGESGAFTARKERAGNRRGGWYWKAYRTWRGARSSTYLGQSDTLTLDRLRAAARRLGCPATPGTQAAARTDPAPPAPYSDWDAFPGHDDPLVATKLCLPRLPRQMVPRSELLARLRPASRSTLTLLAAPAGCGKTTLLSAWLRETSVAAAWVSLDSGDDDPTRFWSYTLTALDAVYTEGGLAAMARPLLRSPRPPPFGMLLTAIINRLAALPAEVLLVFDDYHVITAAPIHAALTFLLDHLPARLHLVIATRAEPPLPLARLRAEGKLLELRAEELRFTRTEMAAFLVQSGAPALSAEEIAILDARTEGWIAGVQVAALALQGRQDTEPFVRAFSGTHRFVVDYLTQEVLARQPDGVQDFLLQTAVLERLCGPLCEAVTVAPAGQAMLEQLEQANLFLVPLDAERRWYRYHHLFAEMLRQREQHLHPERVAELHRRASAWYARQDMSGDAVHHALAAATAACAVGDDVQASADNEQAARLIEATADLMARRGEMATMRAWLAALPADLVRARVDLCLWQAWLLVLDGQFSAADGLLQHLERAPQDDTAPLPSVNGTDQALRHDEAGARSDRAGRLAAIRAFIAFWRGDVPRTITLACEALEYLPPEKATRGLVVWYLGIAHLWNGDLIAGSAALNEARAISLASGNSYVACMATFELAQAQVRHGQLHQAEQTYRQGLELATAHEDYMPAAGPLYVGYGDLQREWNNLDAAAQNIEKGIAGCRHTGNSVILLVGHIALARVRQAQRDAEGVHRLRQSIGQALRAQEFPPHTAAQMAAWLALLALRHGDLAAATRWARERRLCADDELDPPREIEYLTWARVLLAQRRPAEAAPLLDRLLRLAQQQGRVSSVLEILVLQALIQQARGNGAGALERLGRALALAEPEGYIRLFVDEGTVLARLLWRLRLGPAGTPRGSASYRDHLLALLGGTTAFAPPRGGVFMPGEALRDRELEVLRLIAAGYSNREIADQMTIAVSTVKWYLHALYGKLQAGSRTQAVARARDLDIV